MADSFQSTTSVSDRSDDAGAGQLPIKDVVATAKAARHTFANLKRKLDRLSAEFEVIHEALASGRANSVSGHQPLKLKTRVRFPHESLTWQSGETDSSAGWRSGFDSRWVH